MSLYKYTGAKVFKVSIQKLKTKIIKYIQIHSKEVVFHLNHHIFPLFMYKIQTAQLSNSPENCGQMPKQKKQCFHMLTSCDLSHPLFILIVAADYMLQWNLHITKYKYTLEKCHWKPFRATQLLKVPRSINKLPVKS